MVGLVLLGEPETSAEGKVGTEMSTVAWAVAESIAGPVGENNAVVAVMEGTQ